MALDNELKIKLLYGKKKDHPGRWRVVETPQVTNTSLRPYEYNNQAPISVHS